MSILCGFPLKQRMVEYKMLSKHRQINQLVNQREEGTRFI